MALIAVFDLMFTFLFFILFYTQFKGLVEEILFELPVWGHHVWTSNPADFSHSCETSSSLMTQS